MLLEGGPSASRVPDGGPSAAMVLDGGPEADSTVAGDTARAGNWAIPAPPLVLWMVSVTVSPRTDVTCTSPSSPYVAAVNCS